MIDFHETERRLAQSTLPYSVRQCSPHHFQIMDGDKPVIDVWPSKDKFMRCQPEPGEKAQVGEISDLLKIAYAVASMSEPRAVATSTPKATLRGLAEQMLALMHQESIFSLKLTCCGDLDVSYQPVRDPSAPF